MIKDDTLSRCVKCGSCKAFCPTYAENTIEPMTARGRLMLLSGLYQGYLKPTPLLRDRLFSCTLCGICETLCPSGVDIMESIFHGRAFLRPHDRQRRYLRAGAKFSFKRPHLGFKALGLILPHLLKKGGFPFELSLPPRPLRDGQRIFKGSTTQSKGSVTPLKGRVALFTGCSVNFLFPSLGERLINVLLNLGYEVVLPPGEVCCGAPLRALGLEKEAARLSKRNIEVFGKLRADAVLSLCPTCTLTLKLHYPKLIGQGLDTAMDVSEFLVDKGGNGSLRPANRPEQQRSQPADRRVLYHEPCHLGFGLGVKEDPRKILEYLGYEIIEPEEPGCCGFSLSLTHKEISLGLLRNRLKGATALPAGDRTTSTAEFDKGEPTPDVKGSLTVVTSCPGCMLQLGRQHKNVVHIIEMLGVGR